MLFRKAILIIHGFAGGTYDEEFLAHRLELIRNFDVYTFTLAGHDGLFKSNMNEAEWIKSAEDMMEFLIKNRYKTIYVVGHSMGGVIATHLANKYKEVKKIVLVAAAFRFAGYKEESFKIIDSLKETPKIFKDYSKDEIMTRLIKMPIHAVKEFANLVRNNEKNLKTIKIPVLIIQGNNDSLVPLETADFIYNEIPSEEKNILICDGVTHDVFRSKKKQEITKEIIEFLK
jgi:esterase/lipase